MSAVVALCVALAAVVALLTSDPSSPPAPAERTMSLSEAYPAAKIIDSPGVTADGAQYLPLFYVDAQLSVGTAKEPGGDNVRLVMRSGETERELRRLAGKQTPEFGGFNTDGSTLIWLEATQDLDGAGRTRIWAADLAGGEPRMLTEDTGYIMLFDRQADLALHDAKVSWVAAADGDSGEPLTELRTVKLSGGKVAVQLFDGPYSLIQWPWLTSVSVTGDGPIELRESQTDERWVVGVQPGELVACSPTWCRSVVPGTTEDSTIIELMRPDGKDRFRTVAGSVAASIADVALLDRFEIYSRGNNSTSAVLQLLIYDLEKRQSVLVTEGAGQVLSRNGVLWWSSGDRQTLVWHSVSLSDLVAQQP